jgi:hypothetical protein
MKLLRGDSRSINNGGEQTVAIVITPAGIIQPNAANLASRSSQSGMKTYRLGHTTAFGLNSSEANGNQAFL